ncbi:MAG: tetratricopeptide repeat protein [Deltaproteobacteria bacterium]|nr:tetratricopeptide repeat protein [Deltaproteobacteria bacterium]MBK8715338.1 tetratricopeptide repeat protein [Deltaproteobacteria bacterium]MBP7284959.1 tetratricopeptide repeat protein [Nannocystaceae bacterium]
MAAAAFRDDTALAEAATAATEAEALQQPWYVAEARMIEGKIVDRNGDIAASERSFHAAFSAALASNRHDLAVSAAIGVAGATAARGDHDNALRWLDHAEAERTRTADADGELARSIASTRGQLAFHHDDLELARALFTEVLALERAQGDNDGDDDGLPATLLNIGLAEANLGHADAALGWLERSLAGEVRRHGERHPALFRPLNAICHVQTDRGETTAAIAACQRAIDLVRSARPGADPRLSPLYTNLGTAWFEAGDTAAAERAHLAALDNAMRMQPDDVLLLASIENNLGVLYGHLERFEPAAQHYGAAHARLLRAFGPDHPSTALVATNLAMVWVKQGRFDAAEALLRDGLARMRARLGDEHPDLALSYAELGRIQRERGDAAGAVELFERAWALRAATGGDDLELADTSWGLAWSLVDSGGDRGRVDALVEQAEALYRRHGGAWNDKADEMLAWHGKLPKLAGR